MTYAKEESEKLKHKIKVEGAKLELEEEEKLKVKPQQAQGDDDFTKKMKTQGGLEVVGHNNEIRRFSHQDLPPVLSITEMMMKTTV
eukprot:Pgem_evm1s8872